MVKLLVSILLIGLMTASAAQAQNSGRGGSRSGRSSPSSQPAAADRIEIIGVIKAIDPAESRLTIAYEPVEALSWPAGTMPFAVSKPQLLKDAAVGEKVRFRLESQQISELEPFVAAVSSSQ